MPKIFITGSTDGIGLESAKMLEKQGYEIVFHARNQQRADELKKELAIPSKILIADLSDMEETKVLAKEVNDLGEFEAIIHNAGVLNSSYQDIFKINVLAPYILTSLINKPKKLVYIGSNMHPQGVIDTDTLSLNTGVDYSTSKLMILMFSLYLNSIWKDTKVYTVDPGWVKTKMANYNAPDTLEDGSETQAWLAASKDDIEGKYFYHLKVMEYAKKADDIQVQNKLIKCYEKMTNLKIV